jgi:hypothetical protein
MPRSNFYALPPTDKVIVDLLMHGNGPTTIAALSGKSRFYIKNRLCALYERFRVSDEPSLDPRVAFAVFVHSHRHQFGVSCIECDAKVKVQ